MKALLATALAASLVLAIGCQKKGQDAAKNSSVTDITPTAAAPIQPAPLPPIQPTYTEPAVATAVPSTPSAPGSTYTVKRGDTLMAIARTQYGDATQWKKIKAANPSIGPNNVIKVGQKLVLP